MTQNMVLLNYYQNSCYFALHGGPRKIGLRHNCERNSNKERYVLFTVTINRCMRNSCKEQNYQHFTRAMLMYKVKNGLVPVHIADLFVVTNSQYHLRNSDFAIPRFRTVAYGKHILTYLGPVIWFKLDKSICTA